MGSTTEQPTEGTVLGNNSEDTQEITDISDLVDSREEDRSLSHDEIFELLKNQRRRDVLEYLKSQEDRTATLDELATHIAAKENNIEVAQLSSSQRKRVYIGLYQSHLPKMDDLGVIDYNQSRGKIELNDMTQLEPHLDVIRGDHVETHSMPEPSTPLLGVSVLIGIFSVIGLAGLGPLSIIPGIVWGILFGGIIGALTAYSIPRYLLTE